jgi:hypothetical protein
VLIGSQRQKVAEQSGGRACTWTKVKWGRQSSARRCEEIKPRPRGAVATDGIRSPHVVSHACTGDRSEPFKRPLWLTSGPRHFFDFFKIFNLLNFETQISDLPSVQNSPNFA